MTDAYLLVPMQLDAMVLNQEASVATPFLRFQMQYSNLGHFASAEPPPFGDTLPKPPGAGIYLHWTLPKGLRHGTHKDDGTTEFPCIPNRWLVSRIQAGVAPGQAVKAWILASDYLGDTDGSSPYVHPTQTNEDGTPHATLLGKAWQLSSASAPPTQSKPFLTALGPGSATFSVFSPGVENVLSFHDDVSDGGGQAIAQGSFTYCVVGWYAAPVSDPLGATAWQPNTDPKLAGTYVNDTFDWYVYADSADLPRQMLVHTLVSGVSWDRNAENPPAPTYPTDTKTTVKVAVGNTAIDALAAIVRLDRNSQTEADLLEAFQYGLLDQLDQPGSSEALNAAIRQHWFGASPGGTLWQIVPAERTDSTALPRPAPPVMSDQQVSALAALNAAQRELDRQQRILESMQWNLFGLWWKYQWQSYPLTNHVPLDDDMISWLQTQLPLQLGVGSTCSQPGGTDPAQESWYICKVRAQQNLVGQRAAQVDAARTRIETPGFLDARQELKATNMLEYYYPHDPVLLVTGLGRSTNFDPEDGVLCRLPSQTVAGLTVGGVTYCADASCDHTIQSQLPVLADPSNLLPAGAQGLHVESCFLSPSLFARDILGDAGQIDAVRQGLKALPHPAAGVQFPPIDYAMGEWEQPWVPLLLDWQIKVVLSPAYTQTGKAPWTFNGAAWQFDGTDYRWNGSTDPGAFSEGGIQLKGRTFITPHLSFSLADQLEQYVNTHTLRDPALENLLKDLEGYIEGIKNQDILSQRLSGLLAMMVERSHADNVIPFGDVASAVGNAYRGYPMPYPDQLNDWDAPPLDFIPKLGLFYVIQNLTVIDSFGRSIDLMLTNYSQDPQTQNDTAEYYFYPIEGRNVRAPTALDPGPNGVESLNPAQRMIQMTPGPVQDSQLAFRLTSNDGQNDDISDVAGANPICGWIVPNHLNRSLAVYAPDGQAWGELYLSLHAGGTYLPTWQPDPTSSAAPQSVDAIPNGYVRAMLQALCNRQDNGVALSDLMLLIDETLWTINPRGDRNDRDLSVLIGRPLAVVRAELSLRLRGLPYYNQDWANTFIVDPSNLPDPSQPAALGALDGGVFADLWPVRLGSQALRDDALVGYYLDNPTSPATTYGVFNTVTLPAEIQTDYIRQVGQGNYLQLRFTDDSVAQPDPTQNQVCRVTMLVDPRGSVHAFSGLLPVVKLGIPNELVTQALQTMYYLFRAGPFLTSPDALRLPRPAERKGSWSWFDHVLDQTIALSQSDGQARISATAPVVKEGWLKFVPNPPIEEG